MRSWAHRCVAGGLAECRLESFGKGEGAKKERCIESIAGKGVDKQGQAGEIAGAKAGERVRVGVIDLPDSEIRDQKELKCPEDNSDTNAGSAPAFAEPCTDEHLQKKTGIDHRNQAMHANQEVTRQQCCEGKKERGAAIPERGSGKQSHSPDGREVPRMRSDAKNRRGRNHYGHEDSASEDLMLRLVPKHGMN